MRKTFPLIALWLVFALARVPGAASGSTGLPFLRISAGARSAALADAVSALLDVDAASVNPAALQARGRRSVSLTHSAWIQGIRHDDLSLVFSFRRSTLSLNAQLFQADDLERRTGPTTAPLGTFGAYDGTVSLAYARSWTSRLRAGAGLKLIRQSIAARTASGAALDLGMLWDLSEHLHAGLALRNLGRMTKLGRVATRLPRAGHLGLTYTGLSRLLFSLEARRVRGSSTTLHLGTECAVNERLSVRGGYQNADSRGLSAGLGLEAAHWSVDYAFIPFASGLGEAHRLSVRLHR